MSGKNIKRGHIYQEKILKEDTFVRKKYQKTTHLSGKNIKRGQIRQEKISKEDIFVRKKNIERGHICQEKN